MFPDSNVHLFTASFSIKRFFYETKNIFYVKNKADLHKTFNCFNRTLKSEGKIKLNVFPNYAYVRG